MPTIKDIAFKLGISKSTVSKALNNADDVSETLRKRILETAVEIGYEKNRVRKNAPHKLCIIIENMEYKKPENFGYGFILGFEQLAIPAGWSVDRVDMTVKEQGRSSYDSFMLGSKYDGAFILGFSLLDPWMEDLKTARTPAVLYDNYILENPLVAYVGVNSQEGFNMAVSHLKELGHTRIGYLAGGLNSYVGRDRYQAYLNAMKLYGMDINMDCIGHSYFVSECTQKYIPILIKNRVTAILCEHDQLANAVMLHCMELGYKVPEDISVVGFDDAAFSAHTTPPLTTIRQNKNSLGRCGYYALTSLLNNTHISSLLLRAELIERASTSVAKVRG